MSKNLGLDEKDCVLLAEMIKNRNEIKGPRVGDFIFMLDGTIRRFTHDWGDSIQTTCVGSCEGNQSFNIGKSGRASFSGSLDKALPIETIKEYYVERPMAGKFWFFKHGIPRAHNGVTASLECRTFRQVKPC